MNDFTNEDSGVSDGKFAENIMHFARVLRAAGMPVGPGKVLDAVRAVEIAGVGRRDDFYWILFSVFVNRYDQRELFDQAFHIFWRNPQIMEKMMGMLLPMMDVPPDLSQDQQEMIRRLADAMGKGEQDSKEQDGEEIEFDTTLTYSAREVLQEIDFEAMSAKELAEARAAIARMRLPIAEVPTRRFVANARGQRVDMRRSIRAALRSGGDIIPLRKRKRKRRHPPLVVLCDISGSMNRYSRMFLHFMHAITNDRDRVHTFVFGTRLTNITRYLRQKDVDIALDQVTEAVDDWSGGTRIGACFKSFNDHWSRRVLAQGAVVLIISDGLDRDAGSGLNKEMERLHKSCRRLIWLNPLLRYDGFQPKSRGVRAMLPHVDDFRSVHNLEKLSELAEVLSITPRPSDSDKRFKEMVA
jgi:uncharacterized protein with von Willebrand factor type A (vWA) domain